VIVRSPDPIAGSAFDGSVRPIPPTWRLFLWAVWRPTWPSSATSTRAAERPKRNCLTIHWPYGRVCAILCPEAIRWTDTSGLLTGVHECSRTRASVGQCTPWFPAIARRAWWLATPIGALEAYVLGYRPSTSMSLGSDASQLQVTEPPQWVVLLLAAGMGAVTRAVLSFAQWRALRNRVPRAGWWVLANVLAWAAGMPIRFWGIDAAQKG
jgi:hypothetical protein